MEGDTTLFVGVEKDEFEGFTGSAVKMLQATQQKTQKPSNDKPLGFLRVNTDPLIIIAKLNYVSVYATTFYEYSQLSVKMF